MDDEKQWIDYRTAEHLIRVLEKRNLLKLPTFSGQSTLEGVDPDDNT